MEGVPDAGDNAYWHHFWAAKGRVMRRKGVAVYTQSLRYRHRSITLLNGTEYTVLLGEEKGIDVRIALDVVRLAYRRACDSVRTGVAWTELTGSRFTVPRTISASIPATIGLEDSRSEPLARTPPEL